MAIKESSDDIRRSTEIINRFGDRFDLFTGVDNLAFEALSVGAIGWVAGLVMAFPRETVAIYQLMKQGRREEALTIYRWFRPLLDLDVSTYLVQNIKLAEVFAIGTNDRVRMPRQPLSGERRKAVEKIVKDALAVRPELPQLSEGGLCSRSKADSCGHATRLHALHGDRDRHRHHRRRHHRHLRCGATWRRPAARSRSSTAPAFARRPVPAMPRRSPSPTCCRLPTRA